MNNPFENPPKPTDQRAVLILQKMAWEQICLYQTLIKLMQKASLSEAENNLAVIGGLEAFVENNAPTPLKIRIRPDHIQRMNQIFNLEQPLEALEKQLKLRMQFRFKRNEFPRQNQHQHKRAAVLGNNTSSEAWRLAHVLALYVTEVEAMAKEHN